MFSIWICQDISYPLNKVLSEFNFSTAQKFNRKRAVFNLFMSNCVNLHNLSQLIRVPLGIEFKAEKLASHVSDGCTSPAKLLLILLFATESQYLNDISNLE